MHPQRTTWYVGDKHTWAADNYFGPTPTESLDSMGALVTRIAAALHRQQATEGLIVLDAAAAKRTGITDPTTDQGRRQRALDSAAGAGWRHTKIGAVTSFIARERPTVHVGQLARLIDPSDPGCWPFGHRFPADTVAALQAWHRLTGVAWQHGTPVMGLELMHKTIAPYRVPGVKGQRKPDLKDDATPDDASVSMWSPEMWRRPGAKGRYLHAYDKRRAGITAAGVAKLSPARLARRRGPFDPKRAGWWLVAVPHWAVKEMPHPFGPGAEEISRRVGGQNRMWVTTAQMDLAAELGAEGVLSMPDVIDSLTGLARTVLSPWQQTIERAYACPIDTGSDYDDIAQGLVRGALKDAGNAGLGLVGKAVREDEDGTPQGVPSIWRRDWYASVNATKQANAWRTAWRIGQAEQRWPVTFDDDKLWYDSDNDDPHRAVPTACNSRGVPYIDLRHDTPGSYRPEGTVERNAA